MMYRGSLFVEKICFCPSGDLNDSHCIEMRKNNGIFTVGYCCDPNWNYSFNMNDVSDYERVKFNIMTELFKYEEIDELLDRLSFVFEDGFADILIEETDHSAV